MEFCEIPLKDWLNVNSNANMTSEVLENMLSVTCDISKGVQHLHANRVRITTEPSLHNDTIKRVSSKKFDRRIA